MLTEIKTRFLFYTLTLFLCLTCFFLMNTTAQVNNEPADAHATVESFDIPSIAFLELTASSDFNYTFERIDVPGVDFLELTASSDFQDYAGNTLSADGEKIVGFTLIDGVFTTYDFPNARNTYFYALGNNGTAAGHYEDSEGLFHGIVLEAGELREYDFPGAVETFIHGISDATGALTGNFIDASGVRRGFSGERIIEVPGASETYADFVNAAGLIVGSYVDSEGLYHVYMLYPNDNFVVFNFPHTETIEYLFTPAANQAEIFVVRVKRVDDVPRTYVGGPRGLHEFRFPGSVGTEGWNINEDGSVVGYYDTADGRRHGFIARPDADTVAQVSHDPVEINPAGATYTFESIDVPGVDFLEVTASSDFQDYAGNTRSADGKKTVGFTLIDGIFTTYEFPDAQNTYFYALGNNGDAAGHYEDSEGLFHGIVLEAGELREYDFPGAVETFIHGISDATGALTGNFIDASGVRRGFSGDIIVEFPGAAETYADFVNAHGSIVGSYIGADGRYEGYVRIADGRFLSFNYRTTADLRSIDTPALEYIYLHGISDVGVIVARSKAVDDVPRTYVGASEGLHELRFPGAVSTEGWNINQDGSVIGHYDSPDGRRYGFIARPITDTEAPIEDQPVAALASSTYTFESIDVPGVDFLELAASSDFEDYAGNTWSHDGKKTVGFTLIDGVFTTYDFPGSQNTYFYALGNDGQAAGHYEDSNGLYHGVVLQNGELRQYDFPNAVETQIYGISDATGALTGNYIDASGIRRGFTGDIIIEFPRALETYADFVNASGAVVGSYVDVDGTYHPYVRHPNGTFTSVKIPGEFMEYFFLHGLNDAWTYIVRNKVRGDVPRTYVGKLLHGLEGFQFSSDQDLSLMQAIRTLRELQFPGSVSTEGWNINQDGSVVGHYDSPDGRRHGFIARPTTESESTHFGNTYTTTLSKGLNMLAVPLAPPTPMTAKTLAALTGATTVIRFDRASQRLVAWTPSAPNDGFSIEGGHGYIVNVLAARNFAFVGAPWTTDNPTEEATPASPAAPTELPREAWAFVVSGHLEGKPAFDGYQVTVRNLRTNSRITASVQDDYFAAATADLTRRSVVHVGDVVELRVIGPDGNFESQTVRFTVTPEHLANAVLSLRLDGIGQPNQNLLLQNYPNPFNPETWIPYQLSEDSSVSVSIYDTTGQLVRTLSLGFQSAGFYNSRERAAYWDGRNALGERVASGIYFYQLTMPTFQQTRRLVIVK